MNPQSPKFYTLIKLHKSNHTIRPVLSCVTAPARKLSKTLINILINYIFKPTFSLKNSVDLSSDVINLFPSISISTLLLLK